MTSQPKVLIGCPITSYKKEAMPHYLKGLKELTYKNKKVVLVDNSPDEEMFNSLKKEKWLEVEKTGQLPIIRDMLVRDRNRLREITLEQGFDYFFSLEQDVVPPSDAIERLMASNKDVCGGLYFNYKETEAMLPGNKVVKRRVFAPIAYTWADPGLKELNVTKRLSFEGVFPSRLQRIHLSGVGCMLIERKVLEKVKFRYDKKSSAFDDMYFGMDCQDNGFETWLDSRVICMHHFGGLAQDVVDRY